MTETPKPEAGTAATLQDFVLQAFKDISGAVQAFDQKAPEGTTARPLLVGATAGNVHRGNDGAVVVVVEFDVATTNELTKGRSGEVGLAVSVFKAGIGGERGDLTRTENRLKFSLPLQLGRGAEAEENNKRIAEERASTQRQLDAWNADSGRRIV